MKRETEKNTQNLMEMFERNLKNFDDHIQNLETDRLSKFQQVIDKLHKDYQ